MYLFWVCYIQLSKRVLFWALSLGAKCEVVWNANLNGIGWHIDKYNAAATKFWFHQLECTEEFCHTTRHLPMHPSCPPTSPFTTSYSLGSLARISSRTLHRVLWSWRTSSATKNQASFQMETFSCTWGASSFPTWRPSIPLLKLATKQDQIPALWTH